MISGLDTERQRAEEAAAIVNWSFRQFAEKTVAKAGDPIAEARVWMGSEQTVNMVAPEEYRVLLPALSGSDGLTGEVVYQGPVPAPIQQGQQLGELVITREDLPEVRLPLVADRAVATGGFIIKVRTAAELLLTRFSNGPVEPAADAS